MSSILLKDRRADSEANGHEDWRRDMERSVYYAGTENFNRTWHGPFKKDGTIGFHITTRQKQIFGDYSLSQPEPTRQPEWFVEQGPKGEEPMEVKVQSPPSAETWESLQARCEKSSVSFEEESLSRNPFSMRALKDEIASCKQRIERLKGRANSDKSSEADAEMDTETQTTTSTTTGTETDTETETEASSLDVEAGPGNAVEHEEPAK